MLPLLGLVTIVVLLAAILSKRMSPLVALIIVPIVASLIGGFGLQTSKFVIDGLKSLAPVVGMFVFAILYFGTITDAGTLDPIIDRILRTVGTKPTRIVMGTTLLALLIHLDGSGAVCFLVTIPAMLPLYERLNMDKRVLAAAVSMAAGINFLPWTGPMIRASASLHLPISALFNPLIPIQAIGLVFVFSMAWWLGRREEKRLGYASASGTVPLPRRELTPEEQALRRPKNFWFNIVLTIIVLGTMVVMGEKIPPAIMFMVGLCIALMVNYPNVDMQRKRIDAHARAALMMAGILLAAGVFTGVMQGSGMLKAMAQAAVGFVPPAFAGQIPVALGVLLLVLAVFASHDHGFC
ncbi:CitMHS family transporter [Paraburkholderia sp. EG285A]|uniref:CitMHS family transporter n=1 Tax=Paraburkholderia sp. EG285A TaxID=3237009 RepID=UPI0034D32EEE